MNAKTSLKHQGNPLAVANNQLNVLETQAVSRQFVDSLAESGISELVADRIDILQVNLGKLCNMTCAHCHVDAGPDRREIMQEAEIDACLKVLQDNPEISTLDLTGGAPEMNPYFRNALNTLRR